MSYVVTLRDKREYTLPDGRGEMVSKAVEAKHNFYIKDDYISWTEVTSVTRVGDSATVRIEPPRTCGRCDRGWIYTDDGARACSCSMENQKIVADYRVSLGSQGIAL